MESHFEKRLAFEQKKKKKINAKTPCYIVFSWKELESRRRLLFQKKKIHEKIVLKVGEDWKAWFETFSEWTWISCYQSLFAVLEAFLNKWTLIFCRWCFFKVFSDKTHFRWGVFFGRSCLVFLKYNNKIISISLRIFGKKQIWMRLSFIWFDHSLDWKVRKIQLKSFSVCRRSWFGKSWFCFHPTTKHRDENTCMKLQARFS